MRLYREHTPVEKYDLDGRKVYVKREDLYGVPPAPPLAKLRGLRALLKKLHEEGQHLVGCWDTRVSRLGQGLAAACLEFPGLQCIVSYPTRKGTSRPRSVSVACELGAEVYPVPGNRSSICYAMARKFVLARGGVMLPFGLECAEAVEEVAREAARVPKELIRGSTLVLCCGSGVTLAGLLRGLVARPRRIVAISSGRSVARIKQCLGRHVRRLPENLELREPTMPYSQIPKTACPFPTHPNYDLKAWKHLREHLDEYADPVLFWNIGA